jgi:hypothetical protein
LQHGGGDRRDAIGEVSVVASTEAVDAEQRVSLRRGDGAAKRATTEGVDKRRGAGLTSAVVAQGSPAPA